MDISFLTPADVALLREALEELRNRRGNTVNRPRTSYLLPPVHQAPEVYVALTPPRGIPPLTTDQIPLKQSGTGTGTGDTFIPDTGTGSDVDSRGQPVPGSATCAIYQQIPDPAGEDEMILEATGFDELVYNLSQLTLNGGTYVPVIRDKFGYWYAVSLPISSQKRCFDAVVCVGNSLSTVARICIPVDFIEIVDYRCVANSDDCCVNIETGTGIPHEDTGTGSLAGTGGGVGNGGEQLESCIPGIIVSRCLGLVVTNVAGCACLAGSFALAFDDDTAMTTDLQWKSTEYSACGGTAQWILHCTGSTWVLELLFNGTTIDAHTYSAYNATNPISVTYDGGSTFLSGGGPPPQPCIGSMTAQVDDIGGVTGPCIGMAPVGTGTSGGAGVSVACCPTVDMPGKLQLSFTGGIGGFTALNGVSVPVYHQSTLAGDRWRCVGPDLGNCSLHWDSRGQLPPPQVWCDGSTAKWHVSAFINSTNPLQQCYFIAEQVAFTCSPLMVQFDIVFSDNNGATPCDCYTNGDTITAILSLP